MQELVKRPLKPALWNGFKRKCPNCETGSLFTGYLTVAKSCDNCGEDYTPQRADDGPAWATMLIVGHLVPPFIMLPYEYFDEPAPWKVGLALIPLFIVMTLLLLPRIKGMFVTLQWANRMHGFAPAPETSNKPKEPLVY